MLSLLKARIRTKLQCGIKNTQQMNHWEFSGFRVKLKTQKSSLKQKESEGPDLKGRKISSVFLK